MTKFQKLLAAAIIVTSSTMALTNQSARAQYCWYEIGWFEKMNCSAIQRTMNGKLLMICCNT